MSVEQQTVDTNGHVRNPNNWAVLKGLADFVCQTPLVDITNHSIRTEPQC